jgi:hypothetical protein
MKTQTEPTQTTVASRKGIVGSALVVAALLGVGFLSTHSGEPAPVKVDAAARGDLRQLSQVALDTAKQIADSADGADSRTAAVVLPALERVPLPESVTIAALDGDGVPHVIYSNGRAESQLATADITYIQLTAAAAGVCLRLSADGSSSGMNSNSPVEAGPYNKFVSPLDGPTGPGSAIVGYAMGSATAVPQGGVQNACDGIPLLARAGSTWVLAPSTDAW